MLNPKLLLDLLAFRREREWEQFHNSRNLAAALAIEAGELQEIFLWAKDDELNARVEERKIEIEHEVADIAILLSYFCNDLNIDIDAAVRKKMELNALKYPVEKSRGSSKKYDAL
ncbi:MAG: nucleotide pyrophosphohydrolase [Burkholderiales bacterium PBB3]|nr:MAG: nucleotide pyrophosphohydrolase [Burkholderiales bacterium PBB3]